MLDGVVELFQLTVDDPLELLAASEFGGDVGFLPGVLGVAGVAAETDDEAESVNSAAANAAPCPAVFALASAEGLAAPELSVACTPPPPEYRSDPPLEVWRSAENSSISALSAISA